MSQDKWQSSKRKVALGTKTAGAFAAAAQASPVESLVNAITKHKNFKSLCGYRCVLWECRHVHAVGMCTLLACGAALL